MNSYDKKIFRHLDLIQISLICSIALKFFLIQNVLTIRYDVFQLNFVIMCIVCMTSPTRATLNGIVATWCTLRNCYAILECLPSVRHEVPKHVRVQIYHRNRIRHMRATQARASICTEQNHCRTCKCIHAHAYTVTHVHTYKYTLYRHIPKIQSHTIVLFLKEVADDNSEFLKKETWTREHRTLGCSREMV